MKLKKYIITLILTVFFTSAFCKDLEKEYSLTVDAAFYPLQLRGEGRGTLSMAFKIPTPLGDQALLESANLNIKLNLEITPVSFSPQAVLAFEPLPFLAFESGAKIGTGGNFRSTKGMAVFNGSDDYISLKSFSHWFTHFYFQGTFKFDTGAIFEGDWNHFQLMYTYQVYYSALTGLDDDQIWKWQSTMNRANGWQNYQSLILAYQMPLVLSRVGVLSELEGHYKDSDYNPDLYGNFKGSFKTISISPVLQFTFADEAHTLSLLFSFSSRRRFAEEYTNPATEPLLTYTGREWFFNRIAMSWAMKF